MTVADSAESEKSYVDADVRRIGRSLLIVFGGGLLFVALPLQILFRPNILIYASLGFGLFCLGLGCAGLLYPDKMNEWWRED